MSIARIVLNQAQVEQAFAKVTRDLLTEAAAVIDVAQQEQVQQAFAENGQPGRKWPALWADSFTGSVPAAALQAHQDAQVSLGKALLAKKPNPERISKAQERLEKTRKKLTPATSYRKGGQPLQDNGTLAASFHNKHRLVFDDFVIVAIASSVAYAVYHQEGFTTDGPNFIPLSLRARTLHRLGVNPLWEGLEEGVDYIMAWQGVTVPARPMIDYADPANQQHFKTALAGLARARS